MKHKHTTHRTRWKVAGLSAIFFAVGILLLILSSIVMRPFKDAEVGNKTALASAPAASAPATAPAEQSRGTPDPIEQRKAVARSMSGMLLLIGLMGIAFGAICAGWVAYDIYRSRPAWKTQTKYPRRR